MCVSFASCLQYLSISQDMHHGRILTRVLTSTHTVQRFLHRRMAVTAELLHCARSAASSAQGVVTQLPALSALSFEPAPGCSSRFAGADDALGAPILVRSIADTNNGIGKQE